MKIIKCDRCKAKFETHELPNSWEEIQTMDNTNAASARRTLHLCAGCSATFWNWLDDFVTAPITQERPDPIRKGI